VVRYNSTMEADEFRYAVRDFAIELASALSEAETAARNGSAAALMGALRTAKKAADDLVDNLESS
jgi:hypothetical protein